MRISSASAVLGAFLDVGASPVFASSDLSLFSYPFGPVSVSRIAYLGLFESLPSSVLVSGDPSGCLSAYCREQGVRSCSFAVNEEEKKVLLKRGAKDVFLPGVDYFAPGVEVVIAINPSDLFIQWFFSNSSSIGAKAIVCSFDGEFDIPEMAECFQYEQKFACQKAQDPRKIWRRECGESWNIIALTNDSDFLDYFARVASVWVNDDRHREFLTFGVICDGLSPTVNKRLIGGGRRQGPLRHISLSESPWLPGALLSELLENSDEDYSRHLVSGYRDFLKNNSINNVLPHDFFDAVPSNILVMEGDYVYIDREWSYQFGELTIDYVWFRAIRTCHALAKLTESDINRGDLRKYGLLEDLVKEQVFGKDYSSHALAALIGLLGSEVDYYKSHYQRCENNAREAIGDLQDIYASLLSLPVLDGPVEARLSELSKSEIPNLHLEWPGNISFIKGVLSAALPLKGDMMTESNVESQIIPPSGTPRVHSAEPADFLDFVQHEVLSVSAKTDGGPLISILLPVYHVDVGFLMAAIGSVIDQSYANWELCVAFVGEEGSASYDFLKDVEERDDRIRSTHLLRNLGISGNTNAAFDLASGEFCVLLDHDDELAIDALAVMVEAIKRDPSVDHWYSDKDSLSEDGGKRFRPLVKPEWSPEMLISVAYTTQLNAVRTSLLKELGGWRRCTDGAQDWDLYLRIGRSGAKIGRVPGILYHWRYSATSTASGIGAKPYAVTGQINALRDHLHDLGYEADPVAHSFAGYHVRWRLSNPKGVCALVFLSRNGDPAAARQTADILAHERRHPHTQIIIVAAEEGVVDDRHRVVRYDQLNAFLAETDHPVVSVFRAGGNAITPGFDDEIEGWLQSEEGIGFVGPLVMSDHGTVVEAGRLLDANGTAHPLFRGMEPDAWSPMGGVMWYRNVRRVGFDGFSCRLSQLVSFVDATQHTWETPFETVEAFQDSLINDGRRGLMDGHYQTQIPDSLVGAIPAFHASLGLDPYGSPLLSSICPMGMGMGSWREQADGMSYRESTVNIINAIDSTAVVNPPPAIAKPPGSLVVRTVHFYVPEFHNAAYGGIKTILRFAAFLAKNHDIRVGFVICAPGEQADYHKRVSSVFPELHDADYLISPSKANQHLIPDADVVIATLWTTIYRILDVERCDVKACFVQDYEPGFYPAGSLSEMVKAAYRLGYMGLCNTAAVADAYTADSGAKTVVLNPQLDLDVFHPPEVDQRSQETGPIRIFLYGRPQHPRNCFELAAAGLRLVKEACGDDVEILAAGDDWDPALYDLKGVITNLGTLSYAETGDLYRQVHMGVSLMATVHPSYVPFELMACGSLLVTNSVRASKSLLRHKQTALITKMTKESIADTIIHGVRHYDECAEIRANGAREVAQKMPSWADELERFSAEFFQACGHQVD